MQQQTTDPNAKNIIVGPDYGQMLKLQTNATIVEAFLSKLFSNNTKFNLPTVFVFVRNIITILFIKTLLEDSKSYLDSFKFTNLNMFRHFFQSIRYSTYNYEFVMVCGKWMYGDNYISINTLTPFLEQKSIFISQPGTYYFEYRGYLIKVAVTDKKISFRVPNIEALKRFIEQDIIHKNKEIVFGGKTTMSRAILGSSGVVRIEPIPLVYAFETDNYIKLEESIKNYFIVDSLLKFPTTPFCVNFDGEPGTGKTTFGSYIASSGIFDRIIVCNLIQASKTNFSDLINNLERQIAVTSPKDKKSDGDSETILLIIDEIDKWLESYTANQIQNMREEARGKKQVMNDNKTPGMMLESFEKLTEEEEEDKRTFIKNDFLDQLYRLVEGNMFSDIRKYVIIFNTNNFNKLFNKVDERFEALRDRFTKYMFCRIGKCAIVKYFECFRKKLLECEYLNNVDSRKIASIGINNIKKLCEYDISLYDKIPDSISITYRTLFKLFRNNNFSVEQTINSLATSTNFEILQIGGGCASNDNLVIV